MISILISDSIAVLRMRAKRGDLTGVRVEDMVEFYLGGRAAGTLRTYARHSRRCGPTPWRLGCLSSGGGRER